MNCLAFCSATSYLIKPFYDSIKPNATFYRDVVHISVPGDIQGDLFFFSYGATVSWGLTNEQCQGYLNQIRQFEENSLNDIESDEFSFTFGKTAKFADDEITLPDQEILTKLAISHGIAQSVKLGTFEKKSRHSFNHTKHIPEELAMRGKIGLSRKEIRRKMGELFIERNSINLHMDVLDTPEFFWEYSELEPLYALTANYLDVETRVEVLNYRLNVVKELFEMLGNELNHQHSSRLEWTIIFLIVIEVLLTLIINDLPWKF